MDKFSVVVNGLGNVAVGCVQHQGAREQQEDSVGFTPVNGDPMDGFLAVVADGMGGHRAGNIASCIAVESIVKYVETSTITNTRMLLQHAISYANKQIFDAAQQVVNQSAGVIIGNTSIDIDSIVGDLQTSLEAMSLGGLIGLWFQSLFVGLTMNILSICIFLVTYGRMIEIYAVTALGPIPLATLGNAEWRGMGQNYLKSLLALGFQAFLIMVVVGIYAVLIQQIGTADDISGAIWGCMGYTVLLCFCLFKTGSISKAVFTAH